MGVARRDNSAPTTVSARRAVASGSDSATHRVADTDPDRAHARLVVAFAIGVVALHLTAVWGPTGFLWGAHHYAFFPRVVLALALAGLAAALAATWAARPGGVWPEVPRVPLTIAAPPWLAPVGVAGLAVVAFALFWTFRIRHRFLGDALVMVQTLPSTSEVHPLEPVAMALQRDIYQLAHRWFERPGLEPADVAHLTTALGSAVAGVLFVFTCWGLARELVAVTDRSGWGRGPGAHDGVSNTTLAGLVCAVLLTQGYIQLFFGYVENYTFVALAVAYYIATALAFLSGRGGLLPVALAASVASCLHLSTAALLPSLAVLIGAALTSPGLRAVARRDAVPVGVLTAVIAVLLASMGGGYDFASNLGDTMRKIVTQDVIASPYLLSLEHARDIFNLQILIGPAGLVLALGAAAFMPKRSVNVRVRTFLLALVGTYLVLALIAGDSNLGYARNWDLLAPMGIPFTATALFLLLEQSRDRTRLRRTLLTVGLVSLFHSGAWVALNASLERSLERFKTLPLGGGRTESTVGYWYASQDRPDLAEPWLLRSLRANPDNARAHLWLGHVYMMTDRSQMAVEQFKEVVRIRPDVQAFNLSLVNAMVLARRPDEALDVARRLVDGDPTSARLWAVLGTVLLSLSRADEAHDAFLRAVHLAPDDGDYLEMSRLALRPGGIDPILDRYWTDLTL